MEKTDFTYSSKIKGFINVYEEKRFDIVYTVDGDTFIPTTTSILINNDPLTMITFDYQELKKIIEGD